MNERLNRTGIAGILEVVEGCLGLCSIREQRIIALDKDVDNLRNTCGRAIALLKEPDRVAVDFIQRRGVVVVDPNPIMRRQLVDLFNHQGIEVFGEAANGSEAVEIYRLHRPVAVTMDMNMPVMDGYEATLQIKRIDPYANIIFVSHVLDRKQVLKAMQCGAVDYLSKPVDSSRLLDLISKLLDSMPDTDETLQ